MRFRKIEAAAELDVCIDCYERLMFDARKDAIVEAAVAEFWSMFNVADIDQNAFQSSSSSPCQFCGLSLEGPRFRVVGIRVGHGEETVKLPHVFISFGE